MKSRCLRPWRAGTTSKPAGRLEAPRLPLRVRTGISIFRTTVPRFLDLLRSRVIRLFFALGRDWCRSLCQQTSRKHIETPKYAYCAGRAPYGRRSGCARSSLFGAHFHINYQLPRLPLPVQALRSQKHVGDFRGPTSGGGPPRSNGSGTRDVDPAAANCARAVSSRRRTRSFREFLGHRFSSFGLVSLSRRFGRSAFASHCRNAACRAA